MRTTTITVRKDANGNYIMSKKGTRYLVLGFVTETMDSQLAKMGINVGDAWRCTAPIANLTSITDFLMNKSYDLKGIIISDFHENPNAGTILIGVIEIYKKHGLDTSSLEAYYSEKILSQEHDLFAMEMI